MTEPGRFLKQQVPQSLYRNTLEDDDGERKELNLSLSSAGLKSKEDKAALKALIDERFQKLISSLVLEPYYDQIDREKVLEKIYKDLKLS